jgi:hypothetical protein
MMAARPGQVTVPRLFLGRVSWSVGPTHGMHTKSVGQRTGRCSFHTTNMMRTQAPPIA